MLKNKILLGIIIIVFCFTIEKASAQKPTFIPPPQYHTKYYFRHFDYPLYGIELSKTNEGDFSKTPLTEYLNKNYVLLGVREKVGFKKTYKHNCYSPNNQSLGLTDTLLVYSNWGYDSIRSVAELAPLSPYYMFKTEVTNLMWKEFLDDITAGQAFKSGKSDSMGWKKSALYPDTTVWESKLTFNQPFVNYYFQHPAYHGYPVVGISQFQATQFTDWLEFKLNSQFKQYLPKGYRIQVDLPTAAEFSAAVNYNQTYWAMKSGGLVTKKQLKNVSIQQRYYVNNEVTENPELISWVGSDYFSLNVTLSTLTEINGGDIITQRGVYLRDSKRVNPFNRSLDNINSVFFMMTVQSGSFPISNLQGNVEEWTSTRAKGHLLDAKQWMYTRQGRLIINPDIHVPESELEGLLHTEKELNTHFAVKGGSWNDEFHYLDPWAVKIQRGDYKSATLGFRIVIRIVSEM